MKTACGKRIRSLLLVVWLLFGIGLSALAADETVQDGFVYYEIVGGEATAVDCDAEESVALVLPDSVNGCPVTRIEDMAFSGAKFTSATIPESVTSIGEQAFGNNSSLTSVSIGKGTAEIGEQAFYGCTRLTQFSVDEDNAFFAADASGSLFSKDKMVLIQYPVGKSDQVFAIPDGVTGVAPCAFAHARNLQSVTLPDSVTSIGAYAFHYCAGLDSVLIPDLVTELGFGAFEFCSNLTTFHIGRSVAAIGESAFRGCKKLTQITVETESEYFTADDNVLYTKDKRGLVQYPVGDQRTSFAIPAGVTSIGASAFCYAENLKSVCVPDGFEEFGESAFYHCTALNVINLPGSVNRIGGDAFRACKDLERIVLPDGLTDIGYYAFYECESLERITIPDSVTHVGYRAFYGCESLSCAHIPTTIDYLDGDIFANCVNLAYVCSDFADCYAKTYAAENGLPFHVCGGRHPIVAAHHPDSVTNIHLEYEDGAFHSRVFLLAERVGLDELSLFYPDFPAALALNPRETVVDAYRISLVDEAGEPVRLNAGHQARLFFPTPEDGNSKESRVCRIANETGSQIDSYKSMPKADSADKALTVTEDNRYFILESDSFGAFLLVEETIDPTVSINGFTAYRKEGYKTTIHFSASAYLPPDGSSIHWFLNDTDSGTGESFTVRRAKESYTVQVKLMDEDGVTVLAESEVESVTIQTGFWAKLLAFLRMIVFLLPNITQE